MYMHLHVGSNTVQNQFHCLAAVSLKQTWCSGTHFSIMYSHNSYFQVLPFEAGELLLFGNVCQALRFNDLHTIEFQIAETQYRIEIT